MKQKCYKPKNNPYICAKQDHRIMKMYSQGFNTMLELNNFVNSKGIKKEDIVNIVQSKDGTFFISWYEE